MMHPLGLIALFIFGAAIIIGAFNAKKLIAWENRQLTRLADRASAKRGALEEERGGCHDT